MFELKLISREAIPEALVRAERYRLLNDPSHAESICEDILRVDPQNQRALVTLLLARSDQFDRGAWAAAARELLPKLHSEYERAYYSGLLAERLASAVLHKGSPGAGLPAYDLYLEAMEWYEKAETLRPPGNDDAILRWNTCARMLMSNHELRPRQEDAAAAITGE